MKKIITREEILDTVKRMALDISRDYKYKNPLLICVMDGAEYFLRDLVKYLTLKKYSINYIKAKSYNGIDSTGTIELTCKFNNNIIEGRDIIIVDDIYDTGLTLKNVISNVACHGSKTIKTCVLIHKVEKRKHEISIDYFGFLCNRQFLVGYGTDYNGKYRDLLEIYELTNESS